MTDQLIRGLAGEKHISVMFCDMKDTCNEAVKIHNLKGTAAQALSEALIGTVLVSSTLKNSSDYVTLKISGNGPAQGIVVTANQDATVKGYMINPTAQANSIPSLLGSGTLLIIKDIGMREPYGAQIPLSDGEIADDITSYFSESEQIRSACSIEVVLSEDGSEVKEAGGFLIQLLPQTPDDIIRQLDTDLAKHPSPVKLIEKYPADYKLILENLLPALNCVILTKTPVQWYCNCSKERISKALVAMGKEELDEIIEDGETIEVLCDFCNKRYHFKPKEIREIRSSL